MASRGESAEQTFDEAGSVEYFCQPHANFMDGVITVVGGGGNGDGATSGKRDDQDPPMPLSVILLGLVAAAVARRR